MGQALLRALCVRRKQQSEDKVADKPVCALPVLGGMTVVPWSYFSACYPRSEVDTLEE